MSGLSVCVRVNAPENPRPWQAIDEVFSIFNELPISLLCHWALVIPRWINVIRAVGCLRSFLMHCFGHSTYVVQINTKLVFLLEAFGENEWFVLLMKGAYISAHSCLSAALSAYGCGDGIHHLSAHEQMCWRQPDWSVKMSRAAPVLGGGPANCIIFRDSCLLAQFCTVGQ